MRIIIPAALSACIVLFPGCTPQTMSRNVYEGVKSNNETLNPVPPESASQRAPNYDEYERERRRLSTQPTPR